MWKAAAAGLAVAALISLTARGVALQTSTLFNSALIPLCLQGGQVSAMEAISGRPRAVVEPVSQERLSHVPGNNVSVVRVKFPPGGFSPKHYHGGSVTIYVLSGAIRSQLEGQPAVVYKTGETFFEPLGAIHLFAENVSDTESAEVLAVFVHDEGAQLTTYF